MLEVNINKIELKKVRKKLLLNNIKFTIPANSVYTIIGKNGSGKTSLLLALTGLLSDQKFNVKGSVIFQNKDLLTLPDDVRQYIRKNKIRYVFQDAANTFDSLKTFGYYFNQTTKDLKAVEQLLSYMLLPPHEKLFDMYPYEISGGMAQKIAFCLALLSEPDLLILDEPTSGIDNAAANLILLKLKEYVKQENKSILLVTQDIYFAKKISDKIGILNNHTIKNFYHVHEFFRLTLEELVVELYNYFE